MKFKLHTLTAGCILAVTSALAQCPTPQAEELQTLCTGARVREIVLTATEGATINYFFVGFVLQQVSGDAELIDGGRYSISQTVNGCTSGSAPVFITLTDAPAEPGGAATQEFTAGETVASLDIEVAIINTVKWYTRNDAFVYTQIENNAVLQDGTTYYVTQSNGNCESAYHGITVTQIMGSLNPVFKGLSVYANPASNVVTVKSNEAIAQIRVSNTLGQTVLNQTVNTANAEVNVSALSAGTYILQAYTLTGLATVKVVKQ